MPIQPYPPCTRISGTPPSPRLSQYMLTSLTGAYPVVTAWPMPALASVPVCRLVR